MRLMRPAAIRPTLAIAVCVLAGCGGATHVAGQTPSTATAAVAPPTKAQAAAFAHSVNLRSTDLPNMRITKGEHHEKVSQIDRSFRRCLGDAKAPERIADVESPTFTGETEGEYEYELIGSDIEAEPSQAIAAEDGAHLDSAHGLACIRHFVALAISKGSGGIRFAPARVTRLPSLLPGVAGSFGYRFKTAIVAVPESNVRVHFPIYVDVFGFAAGRADFILTAVGEPEPVPSEAEQRLISLLYSRASSAHL